MGILNVTPDSFSDGGTHNAPAQAMQHALQMVEDGADIIDIGGESTRPGAQPVSASEEIDRTVPVIESLAKSDCAISIDTMKADVARAALNAGACIINDVSACTSDPLMPEVAANSGAGVVLMHMKGAPRTMQSDPRYQDVVPEIAAYLGERANALISAGADAESIVLDPGIGFGKTQEHNLALLSHLEEFAKLNFPLLIGISRKSFIGKITGRDVNERLAGSLAGLVWCIMKGVYVVRVHDVPQTLDAVKLVKALKEAQ